MQYEGFRVALRPCLVIDTVTVGAVIPEVTEGDRDVRVQVDGHFIQYVRVDHIRAVNTSGGWSLMSACAAGRRIEAN